MRSTTQSDFLRCLPARSECLTLSDRLPESTPRCSRRSSCRPGPLTTPTTVRAQRRERDVCKKPSHRNSRLIPVATSLFVFVLCSVSVTRLRPVGDTIRVGTEIPTIVPDVTGTVTNTGSAIVLYAPVPIRMRTIPLDAVSSASNQRYAVTLPGAPVKSTGHSFAQPSTPVAPEANGFWLPIGTGATQGVTGGGAGVSMNEMTFPTTLIGAIPTYGTNTAPPLLGDGTGTGGFPPAPDVG